ncbi:MAG: hypothetical protein Q4Q53_05810 [Methanocorpusculum sp.]|nr:hypothetical protein [Methanocorpusculum sp.]
MKYFFIFAGPNGSGKSSVIENISENPDFSPVAWYVPDFKEILYVNADFAAKSDDVFNKQKCIR